MRDQYRKYRVTSQHLFYFFLNDFFHHQNLRAARVKPIVLPVFIEYFLCQDGRGTSDFDPKKRGWHQTVTRFLVSPAKKWDSGTEIKAPQITATATRPHGLTFGMRAF